MEWGRTGFICSLTHRVTEKQRNFGKLSLETVGFGVVVSAKTWELERERRGRSPLSSGDN